jgi:hypothetical protein
MACHWQPAALARGLGPLLEISSKSELEVGQKLSAFRLKIEAQGETTTVECAFQGSKVFEFGGPFADLFQKTSIEANREPKAVAKRSSQGLEDEQTIWLSVCVSTYAGRSGHGSRRWSDLSLINRGTLPPH